MKFNYLYTIFWFKKSIHLIDHIKTSIFPEDFWNFYP